MGRKCKNCGNINIEYAGGNYLASRNYKKSITNSHSEFGTLHIQTQIYFCIDCGHVFEEVIPSQLEEYVMNLEYITDKANVNKESRG